MHHMFNDLRRQTLSKPLADLGKPHNWWLWFLFLFLFTYLFNFVFCVVDRMWQTDWVSQTGIFSRSFDLRFIPRKVQVPSFLGKAVGWGLIADNPQTENLTPEWKITDHGYRNFISLIMKISKPVMYSLITYSYDRKSATRSYDIFEHKAKDTGKFSVPWYSS